MTLIFDEHARKKHKKFLELYKNKIEKYPK